MAAKPLHRLRGAVGCVTLALLQGRRTPGIAAANHELVVGARKAAGKAAVLQHVGGSGLVTEPP